MSSIKKRGTEAVTIDDVRRAATRIEPLIHRTPVLTSRLWDAATGLQCFFKCENLQRGGAFKIRGAANFLLSIPPSERARGVVAFSSGNHAQAVAIAARELGVRAKIAMPTDAPAAKLEATKDYGAEVVFYDRLKDDREAVARRLAEENGALLVPPFDHEWIIAGQGTAALELLEDVPDLDAIVACVGGGGLLAGTSIAAKGVKPDIRVFGAEPEQANDTYLSLRAGHRDRDTAARHDCGRVASSEARGYHVPDRSGTRRRHSAGLRAGDSGCRRLHSEQNEVGRRAERGCSARNGVRA